MQLSRESIQRMIGSGKGLTVGYGGSSSGGSGGGVSIPYYNQNFELLYKKVVTDGTTGTVTTQYLTAQPNEIVNVGTETDPSTGDVTVTTIVGPKAKTALVIGDAMLVWDAQNSAVYVINRDGTTAANFYATGGVSSLGYSPGGGGGGGGGVSALTDLLDVQISSPSNGQALVYDTSLSPAKWVNKTIFESMTYGSNVLSLTISGVTRNVTIQAGTSSVDWANITNKPNTATRWPTFAEVTSKPTTLGGYGITDAYISNGTIYLGSNSITPVTSLSGYATQQWVTQQGYLTSSAISDMATKTWINNWFVKDAGGNLGSGDKIYSIGCKRVFSGYDMPDAPVDNAWVSGIALGSNWNDNHYQHYLVESGDRWYTTREYSSGSMSGWNTFAYLTDNVASATKLQTARTIWGRSFDGTANITGDMEDVGNILQNGQYTVMGRNEAHGALIESLTNTVTIGLHNGQGVSWDTRSGSGYMLQLVYDASNTVAKRYTCVYDGLRIGDGMIVWDSTNNAFRIIKSDGTAANLYTTGGVSALGMSAGVSSIDAMTFGNLTVNSRLTLPSTIVAGTSPTITQYANDSDCIYLFNDSATSKINSKTYRFTQYDNVGIHGTDYNYGETWWIDPDGCALFQRLYLNNDVYIFTDGSNIKCRIGSNVYTLTKS